jgi:hypothetical protein
MMVPKISCRARYRNFSYYLQFERIALAVVMLMVSIIDVYAIVITATKLAGDMLLGEAFLDEAR